MTQKNLLGKSRSIQNPYAIYKGQGPFGNTEMHLLKTYQVPANEVKNQYARWFVAVKSDMTHGSYDMGDSYIRDAIYGLTLTYASEEYRQQYDLLEELVEDKIDPDSWTNEDEQLLVALFSDIKKAS
tara:strand:+ start:633 stop:1013 length:381 start_codon:yes stop_codon:yes gene_type:complete